MTDNVLKNKMAKSSKPTSVDYSVVNSLEKWELNNLKNTLALLYIYEHKYLHGKKKISVSKDEVSKFVNDQNLLRAGFFGVLAEYIFTKV